MITNLDLYNIVNNCKVGSSLANVCRRKLIASDLLFVAALLKAADVELNIYRFIDFIWVFTFAIVLNDFDARSCGWLKLTKLAKNYEYVELLTNLYMCLSYSAGGQLKSNLHFMRNMTTLTTIHFTQVRIQE